MKEKEKLLNWSISIITIPLSSMKFCVWRTGDKSLRVKEKFIRKLYISNLISPVLRLFANKGFSVNKVFFFLFEKSVNFPVEHYFLTIPSTLSS